MSGHVAKLDAGGDPIVAELPFLQAWTPIDVQLRLQQKHTQIPAGFDSVQLPWAHEEVWDSVLSEPARVVTGGEGLPAEELPAADAGGPRVHAIIPVLAEPIIGRDPAPTRSSIMRRLKVLLLGTADGPKPYGGAVSPSCDDLTAELVRIARPQGLDLGGVKRWIRLAEIRYASEPSAVWYLPDVWGAEKPVEAVTVSASAADGRRRKVDLRPQEMWLEPWLLVGVGEGRTVAWETSVAAAALHEVLRKAFAGIVTEALAAHRDSSVGAEFAAVERDLADALLRIDEKRSLLAAKRLLDDKALAASAERRAAAEEDGLTHEEIESLRRERLDAAAERTRLRTREDGEIAAECEALKQEAARSRRDVVKKLRQPHEQHHCRTAHAFAFFRAKNGVLKVPMIENVCLLDRTASLGKVRGLVAAAENDGEVDCGTLCRPERTA